jgi:hypothetical protein
MAFRSKKRSGGNDKYLRLTGLWQSKGNSELWTGKAKVEQIEDLIKRAEEALENESPLIFGLWENTKKESKRDPEFSLQCFVGDPEEKPRSSRGRDRDEERGSSRRSSRDKDEENDDKDDNQDDQGEENEDNKDEPDEKEERSSKRSSSKGKSSKRESW